LKKNHKLIHVLTKAALVVVLVASLLSLSSCLSMFAINVEEFADQLLEGAFSDAMSVNFMLTDPASYGAEAAEAVWPRPSSQEEYEDATGEMDDMLSMIGKLIKYEGSKQKELYDFLMGYMESRAQDFNYYYFQDDYLGSYISIQANMPVLLSEYRLRRATDIDNMIAFMEDTSGAFESYVSYEHKKIDAGYGRSEAFYEGALGQTKAVVGIDTDTDYTASTVPDAAGHFLLTNFTSKVNTTTFLTASEKASAITRFESALQNSFLPAYVQLGLDIQNILSSYTQGQLKSQGIVHYTDGQAYYEHLFKSATGSSDSIQTAQSKLIDAYNMVNGEMVVLYNEIISSQVAGYDVDAALAAMSDAEDWSEEGLQDMLDTLDAAIAGVYPAYTRNQVNFSFVAESLKDNYSPAAYFQSPIDDLYADESIIINAYDRSGYLLYDLLAHEGIPGHMYQAAYLKSRTDMHPILQVMAPTSYAEAWATYVQYEFAASAFEGATELETKLFRLYQLNNMSGGYLQTLIDIWVNYEGITAQTLNERLAARGYVKTPEECQGIFEQVLETPTNSATYFYSYLKLMEIKSALVSKGYSELAFHEAILSAPYTFDQIMSIYGI